ncbi:MAG: DUF4249 domain-containing protein [Chitinophagaceae bacterium]|nr:DUF4249 domain-containing protein [Chitinophagaceae bacterium]
MRKWICILIVFTGFHCRDPYNIIRGTKDTGILVIEGILNGNGVTQVTLSRTTTLSDKRIQPETGALLFIESEASGETHLLLERERGVYKSDALTFDNTGKYRLKIQTTDNREYATDYKNFLVTPGIDSITWQEKGGGVQMLLYSHNDNPGSPYYKWDYEETWEYKSAFRSHIIFKEVPPDPAGNKYVLDWYDPANQTVNNSLFTCYNSRVSTSINLISTENLGSNVVLAPLRFIPEGSIELSYLYSILVRQYALSKEGYEFFTRMKKNTEQLGSIFDAQPSEISGNVKCVTDPSELVIGYVEASSATEQRIWINNADLPGWGYESGCKHFFEPNGEFSEYPYPNDPSLFNNIVSRNLMPTIAVETFATAILRFQVEPRVCVDCQSLGGHPEKPDFWP